MSASWECTGGCDGELSEPCGCCDYWSPARIEAFSAWARGDLSYDDWVQINAEHKRYDSARINALAKP